MKHSEYLDKTIEVKAKSRPIKIAYIVPYEESSVNHIILDSIFYESYTRWAGVYTLIIPSTTKSFLDSAYEHWIEFFDPDIVYSFLDLNSSLVSRLDRLCSPILILYHQNRRRDAEHPDWRDFVPNWDMWTKPISSITTVQSPYALNSFIRRKSLGKEITVLTQHSGQFESRLFNDNFGKAFNVLSVTHAIPGLFRTLCLVPPKLPETINVGSERCDSIKDVLFQMANRKAIPIARFAMAHSGTIPKVRSHIWSHSFNLVIGDSIKDRIHFWNSRHLTPSHTTNLGSFILGPDFFQNKDQVIQLGQFFNNNNFLGQQNSQAIVNIKSYSCSYEDLGPYKKLLGEHTYNQVILNRDYNKAPLPTKRELEQSHIGPLSNDLTFKLNERHNEIVANEPEFFSYIPPQFKSIASGQWVVELLIQRHNNLSIYSNVIDNWALPRRRKIVPAFTRNLGKVTKWHRLALLPTADDLAFGRRSGDSKRQYSLSLPDDADFFVHLVLDFYEFPEEDLRSKLKQNAYKRMSISDKGQNLRGIISMFGSLSDAYEILTKSYWRDVLRAAKKNSVRHLVFNRERLDAFLPNDRETKERLKSQLNFKNIGEVIKYMKYSLTDTLEHLIRKNIFFQIHQWRCKHCGHINSKSFDGIRIKNNCEICGVIYFTPIDMEWEYQLNQFVHRSLVTHSGLPVLWTLGFLQRSDHKGNFWYLPEVDLYEDPEPSNKNEIDILCMIGGKFCAVEVKTSASIFLNSDDEVDKFVREICFIKPDIAILAFERYCEDEHDVDATKKALAKRSKEIEGKIGSAVELKIIVAHDLRDFCEFTGDLGVTGHRTHKMYDI